MALILGIDPGGTGAIAVVDDKGCLTLLHDMPTVQVLVSGKNRTRIVPAELCRLVREASADQAVVEQVGPMPTDGSQQAFGLGQAYGMALTAIAAAGLPVSMVTPPVWKKYMKVTASKDGARKLAMELWPTASVRFSRVKDDGRAEAALIALYGHLKRNGIKP